MNNITLARFGTSALVAALAVTACTEPGNSLRPSASETSDADSLVSQELEPVILASDGSMASLTAEVRQLRVAVQRLSQSHAETQALSGYLSAQQERVGQVAQRLDAARSEVGRAAERSQQIDSELAILSEQLSRATEQSQRTALEEAISGTRTEKERLDQALRNARDRESELLRELQAEEAQWTDLVSRAEQITE